MSVEKIIGGISKFQKHVYPEHQDLFARLAMGQRPEALFITCADSRIDPCLITQTKPGELFICRVIGNIVPPFPEIVGGVSATIEYAVGILRVDVVIICGHSDCGVMRGALDPGRFSDHASVAAWLRYAEIYQREADPTPEIMTPLAKRNVVTQLRNLRTHPAVAQRLSEGNLALYGWFYDIGTGKISVYDEAKDSFTNT